MVNFKELVEDSVLHEEGEDLRETILAWYIAESDELITEDEDGTEIVAFDTGMEVISELAHIFSKDQVDLIKEKIQEMTGLSDEDLAEMEMYEDSEMDEDDLEEAKKFRIIKKKQKIKLAKKAKAIGKIGKDKAASAEFRAKKVFDPKKKRFVFRKKKRAISQQKRMDRKFTRRLKRRRRG